MICSRFVINMIFSMLKTLKIYTSLLLTLVALNGLASQSRSVVVIIADDFGINDINQKNTPFLNKLKKENLYFSKFITNPRCTPSRMSFLNGYSSSRLGVNKAYNCQVDFSGGHLISSDTTIAEVFNYNGFKTAIIGKWHLGDSISDHPNKNGYDYFFGSISGMFDYVTHVDLCGNRDLQENGKKVIVDKYYTYLITEKSIEYIKNNVEEKYFLQINYTAPHAHQQYPYEVFKADDGLNKYDLSGYNKPDPERHAFMLSSIDEAVQKIYNEIDEKTLFIFFGDNGGDIRYAPKSNQSLRGSKGQSFNGGINTPLIVGNKIGSLKGLNNSLFTILDLCRSIVEYHKLITPSKFEGIKSEFTDDFSENTFFILNDGGTPKFHDKAAFTRKWKWVERNGKNYLFNWALDWEEKNNLAVTNPDTLNFVIRLWNSWDIKNK